MAVAGKVAITPKGEWNESTTYQKLDFVFYNDSSYVSLKPSKGIVPTNIEFWMLALQGASRSEIEGIINGTIQVGDAKTLDGHEVDDFSLASHVHTASQIGLGKVNNTSDSEKPVSTAQAAAIDAAKSAANAYTDTKVAELEESMAGNEVITELQEAIGKKANADVVTAHTGSTSNPHGVTKSQVGLGNVPNVATNDQTPTYTAASADAELTSGEKLSSAFGKIAKAIKSLISHLADTTKHITSSERSTWNNKADASHGTHVSFSTTAPVMDGTASVGSASTVARSDHKHPTDTSRAAATHTHTKSQITDFPTSMPASDVYSWAKASSKPSYTASEVGLGNVPNVATNDQTPTFTVATTRANISTGEKLSVIFGKIAKFFSDLKTVAFTGSYSDLSNKPTIPAAVAVKGDAEASYRTGNVNITAANVGAVPNTGGTINGNTTINGALTVNSAQVFYDVGNFNILATNPTLNNKEFATIETGTFNLTYNGSKVATCNYCKVGKLVYVYAGMTSLSQTVPGNAILSGLPFTVDSALCAIGAIGQTTGNLTGFTSAFTNLKLVQGTSIQCNLMLEKEGPFSIAIIYVTA